MCFVYSKMRYRCGHILPKEITIPCFKAKRTKSGIPGTPCTAIYHDDDVPLNDSRKCKPCSNRWFRRMALRARFLLGPYEFQLNQEQKVWLAEVRGENLDHVVTMGGRLYDEFERWQDGEFLQMIEGFVPVTLPTWAWGVQRNRYS